MRKLWVLVLGVSAALVISSVALGDQPTPQDPVPRSGNILGIVPVHGQAGGHAAGAGGNLAYHGGPVMHANATYAIYWVPKDYSVSPNYQTVIDRFFNDVATDKGSLSNVYYSDTQYYDNANITDNSTFSGSIVDSNPFPSSGCTDAYTAVCLTDGQVQTEINNVITTKGLSRAGTVFFMFTPQNVGSCYSGSQCAFTYYCAYHSHLGSGSGLTLYANMPYAAWVPAACGSGQSPNGDDADSTISVTSHEHNETITDELGNAWYDRRGYENGDKCAWNFGTPLGGTSGSQWNQVIHGHEHYLQQEWSNRSSGCVLTGL